MDAFPVRALQMLLAVVILVAMEWPGGVRGGQSYDGTRVDELRKLEAQAEDRVIRLNNELVDKFASPGRERRAYSFFFFFDAAYTNDNAELKLVADREQFGVVATAFLRNYPSMLGQVFFADLDFEESTRSFEAFRVKTLPQIKYLPPGNASLEDSESLDWNEEGIIGFVESKTRQRVGPLEAPLEFSRQLMIVFVVGLLLISPLVIRRIRDNDSFLLDAKFWILNALLVYFFIVSGGMFGVISGTPFLLRDPETLLKLTFFIQGETKQLGAEGVIIASLYTVVGLFLAFATHFLYLIRSQVAQRNLLLSVMGICYLAVANVIALYHWKAGYAVHGYWPRALS